MRPHRSDTRRALDRDFSRFQDSDGIMLAFSIPTTSRKRPPVSSLRALRVRGGRVSAPGPGVRSTWRLFSFHLTESHLLSDQLDAVLQAVAAQEEQWLRCLHAGWIAELYVTSRSGLSLGEISCEPRQIALLAKLRINLVHRWQFEVSDQ
jgi:hypothetical protein